MTAPGTRLFTHFNMVPEVTFGTPVAPIRQFYVDGSGMFDDEAGLNFHEQENRGVRTRIARSPTQTTEDATVKIKTTQGVAFDELVWFLNMLSGAAAGVGGSADKTWTQTPSMTSANAPKSFSADAGDDIQNWRLQGLQWETIKLTAARGELTQLEADGFAQRAVKTAAASPSTNAAVKIPGDLWTIKFATTAAGLTGASISANFLLDWSLDLKTGIVPRHYMDGNLYIGQSVEAKDISAMLSMTVESTALAISEFYDKYKAQTLDFIRLKATGPVLGSSFYSAQLDLPVYFDKPAIIDGDEDGINTYKVPARLAYDATSTKSIQAVIVNSIATLV